MTRADFIRGYAQRSGIEAPYADIGLLDIGRHTKIALPCACGEDECQGWAIVSADGVDHHLLFDAPDKLREAYREAIERTTP